LTVGLLVAAPKLVAALSWPALLAGLALTVQVYWVALAMATRNVKRRVE
jgi:ATP synthase protein I